MAEVSRRARFLLGACVFTSGACSLGFEVVWAKQLGVVLGGTTAGIAFVVAIFMGGMALGYAAGGRIAARVARPIAAYGTCELGSALLAFAAAQLAPALDTLASSGLSYLAAALLLLPCTFLAGVTLPLLVEGTRGSLGAALGALYGINTFGAVFGVLVTGMFLVGALGLKGTAGVLAVTGALVGMTAMLADRRGALSCSRAEPRASTSAGLAERPAARELDGAPVREPRWQTLALVVGFLSLGEEVLWVRCLIPQLNSSTYALSAILAAFLLGLALGASAAARLLRAGADALTWFSGTQLAAGLFVLFSPEALSLAELSVPGYVGVRQIGGLSIWLSVAATSVGRAVAALILPTLMLGFALPLLVELCAARQSRARGRHLGGLQYLGLRARLTRRTLSALAGLGCLGLAARAGGAARAVRGGRRAQGRAPVALRRARCRPLVIGDRAPVRAAVLGTSGARAQAGVG